MIRILNLEPEGYSPSARRIIESVGRVTDGPLTRADLLKEVGKYEVLIVRLGHQIDREVIQAAERLKVVVSATTGLDHLDLSALAEWNTPVLSLRGENAFLETIPATAEHTWALLLSLLRHIPQAFASVTSGQWSRDAFRGNELQGKRLGVLGLGRIGRQVARYGLAFGMSVGAFDPYQRNWMDEVSRFESLEGVLSASDVLSIHIHLTNETAGLIADRELRLLPAGSVLVNTTRGGIVDEKALLRSLSDGHLSGAALDVIMGERELEHLANNPLITFARSRNNLLITPHIGGATHDSMSRTEVFMARKLMTWLQKQ